MTNNHQLQAGWDAFHESHRREVQNVGQSVTIVTLLGRKRCVIQEIIQSAESSEIHRGDLCLNTLEVSAIFADYDVFFPTMEQEAPELPLDVISREDIDLFFREVARSQLQRTIRSASDRTGGR